jgi:hypothetical protein
MAISENSADVNVPAVRGENTARGVGLVGTTRRGAFGKSPEAEGVFGESDKFHAVVGITHSGFALQ